MRVAALLCLLLSPSLVAAQLFVGIRGGPVSHAGHARAPTEADLPTLHPGVATDLVATIGVDHHAWRWQLAFRRTGADLILGGDAGGVITPGALESRGISAEAGRRVAQSPSGATAYLLIGVVRDRWSFPLFEDPPRSRWSVSLAAEATVPLHTRIEGLIRVESAIGSGLFTADELPEGFERDTARRLALHLGGRFTWR